MLEGLIKAVNKEYYIDSSYKANNQKITFTYIITITQQPLIIRQIKCKYNNYKRDQKIQIELYSLSSWGQNKAKGMPITSKEVIEAYFKVFPKAIKFYNTLPTFLNLLQELFKGVLVIGSYIKLINEVIKSCIDPKLLLAVTLQALDLVDKEAKDKEDKASKLELARSSIKGR